MQVGSEGLILNIFSVYTVYMCVLCLYMYRSLKLLSTHLNCISKQKIHIHNYKTSHPHVLNNIWQTFFVVKLAEISQGHIIENMTR